MGENSETPEPQNTENRLTEREMKRRRDPNEWNCPRKLEFSAEQWANASSFVADVIDRFSDQPDKYNSFFGVMSDVMCNGVPEDVVSRIKEILQGHDDLINKLSAFLASGTTSRAIVIAKEDYLDDPNMKFSRVPLVLPSIPLAPAGEIAKEDDEEVEKEEIEEEEPMYSVERIEKQGIRFCQQVQGRLARAEDYFAFLNLFHCYSSGKIIKEQFENRVVQLIGKHSVLMVKFELFLNHCENFHVIEQENGERRSKKQRLDERKKGRDWKKDNKNSPSYRLPSSGHQLPPTACRRKHKSGLVNDCCEVRPRTRSNNYELNGNRGSPQDLWEDDKYEIDVLLSWFQSARIYGEKLMKEISSGEKEEPGKIRKDSTDGQGEIPEDKIEGQGEIPEDRIEGQATIPEDRIEGQAEIPEDRIEGQAEIPEDRIEGQAEIPEDRIEGQAEIPEDTIEGQGKIQEDNIEGQVNIQEDNRERQGEIPEYRVEGQELHFRRCVERLYGDLGAEVLGIFDETRNRSVALPVIMNRLKQKEEELKQFNKEFDEM